MFDKISKDENRYLEFYKKFSKNLKLGVNDDNENRKKLLEYLRFYSYKSNDKMISFQKYVSEMQEYQKNIFYIAGESIETLKNSPFIEELVNRNYDILLLTDPLDEYVFQQITNYNNKDLVCITKENAKLGDIKNLYSKNSFEKLCIYIKKCLDDDILKVIISNLLIDSPCVLATNKYSWSANMQRIMKAQTLRNYKENFNTKKL